MLGNLLLKPVGSKLPVFPSSAWMYSEPSLSMEVMVQTSLSIDKEFCGCWSSLPKLAQLQWSFIIHRFYYEKQSMALLEATSELCKGSPSLGPGMAQNALHKCLGGRQFILRYAVTKSRGCKACHELEVASGVPERDCPVAAYFAKVRNVHVGYGTNLLWIPRKFHICLEPPEISPGLHWSATNSPALPGSRKGPQKSPEATSRINWQKWAIQMGCKLGWWRSTSQEKPK